MPRFAARAAHWATLRPQATAPSSALPATNSASIAVLPFINLSSDKQQDYFSDGLSEELLNLLSKLPQSRVIARASPFSFKGKGDNVPAIAKALHVAHVLEGRERKLTDVFDLQDEIAGEVVEDWRLVPNDNNVAQQRRQRPGRRAARQGLLGRQSGPCQRAGQLPALLAKRGWRIAINGLPEDGMRLRSGQQPLATFAISAFRVTLAWSMHNFAVMTGARLCWPPLPVPALRRSDRLASLPAMFTRTSR